MKLSHKWLKEYLPHDYSPAQVASFLTDTGLEVESYATVSTVRGGLKGIVVGKVEDVWPHPNADKLKLTRVTIGDGASLQIVCGAPNVAKEQKVVVAPPGTTLYPRDKEPFNVKKAKIRGEQSEGMICAEDEVGLGADHDGIMVLRQDAEPGTNAADYFGIEEDTVFEIDLTPNRAEAMSHIGSARDLMAAMNVAEPGRYQLVLPFPPSFEPDNTDRPIEVEVKNPEACPRYSGLTLTGVKVQESPQWLKNRLLTIGVRPVNNIVDATNFILQEAGQPLHAFDADQIRGDKIIVQTLAEGTSFKTLDDETRQLSADDLMICDTQGGMCIAGVFGGVESGVTEQTTSIFLESAYFNPRFTRKTSCRHNLRTEAAVRFEKGTDPNMTVSALQRAALLIQEVGGGNISSNVVDVYPIPIEDREVELRFHTVYRMTGLQIHPATIKSILADLGIRIVEEKEESFLLNVPPFRVDVTREADVIEEILRIYGYDNIPMPEQLRTSLSFTEGADKERMSRDLAAYLSANGFYQIMNSSITNSDYYRDLYHEEQESLVILSNAMTSELNALRANVLFSGLETICYNQNQGQYGHRYFESGRIYWQENGQYKESERLTLWLGGRRNGEGWRQWADDKTDFYHLKAYLLNILQMMGITNWGESLTDNHEFDYGLDLWNGPNKFVSFGKVSDKLLNKWDIQTDVFYAECCWEEAVALAGERSIDFEPLPKFPQVRRDLSLLMKQGAQFEDVRSIAQEEGGQLLEKVTLFDIYSDNSMARGERSYCVGLIFRDRNKTLTDREVDAIMTRLMQRYRDELSIQIR